MKFRLIFPLLVISLSAFAQDEEFGFNFGRVSLADLNTTSYSKDTAAYAVYLREFGATFFDEEDHNIIHRYHAVIKIFKPNGLDLANVAIPTYRDGQKQQLVRNIKASSFTLENGSLKETPLDQKSIFVEKTNKNVYVTKFAVPNVKVGSLIEYVYETKSPYIYNLKSWEFQDVIPKVSTEYVVTIPALYIYNISLVGFLKLQINEAKALKACISIPQSGPCDCNHFRYGMSNVPAFKEEEYMTAKKNFLSAINFELSEIYLLNGGVDKITKEWRDAELELKRHENFGIELKRNRDLMDDEIAAHVAGTADPLEKAKKIYKFVQNYFTWDGSHTMWAEGIKKAVEQKKGNTADINLFLTGALQTQGFDAAPVILSTRANGAINELYPVLSGFNYVVAGLTIGDTFYLLDATDHYLPFRFLPEKCLNGKGRLITDKASKWVDLKPAERGKNVILINATLENDGVIRGTIESTYMGYEAVSFRKEFFSHDNHEDYLKDLRASLSGMEIKKMDVEDITDVERPVVRKLEVEIAATDDISTMFLFNPYFLGKWKENPFKSNERQYPVDFGVPVELTTILNLTYPSELEIVNVPEQIGLSLPNSGGRYVLDAKGLDNKLTLTNSLQINKSIFSSQEYHYLRGLFQKVIEVQNSDLMFKKKI
jgi:hypothetical protein